MSSLGWGFVREATLYTITAARNLQNIQLDPALPRQPCLQIHQPKNDITATGWERDGSTATQAAQEMPAKRVGSVLYFEMHKKEANTVLPLSVMSCFPRLSTSPHRLQSS